MREFLMSMGGLQVPHTLVRVPIPVYLTGPAHFVCPVLLLC